MGRKAVFLDRDGVINANVFYADTGAFEAPRTVGDFQILAGTLEAMKRLQQAGYLLFIVSNQPNQAKHKATQADHDAIQARLEAALDGAGVKIEAFFYCFHHPNGVEPLLSGPCSCRKPSPYFLEQARREHDLDMSQSWMIGDRETDIACGRGAGVRTIRIGTAPDPAADRTAPDLKDAALMLCED